MKKLVVFCALLALAVLLSLNGSIAADAETPKHTIKEVMRTCMKGDLCKKVASGKANEEEKARLVEMFVSLSKNQPPRGDAESWKDKTGALVAAARAVQSNQEGSEEALTRAANCTACHKAHKE